jgi:hypothetical protein
LWLNNKHVSPTTTSGWPLLMAAPLLFLYHLKTPPLFAWRRHIESMTDTALISADVHSAIRTFLVRRELAGSVPNNLTVTQILLLHA